MLSLEAVKVVILRCLIEFRGYILMNQRKAFNECVILGGDF